MAQQVEKPFSIRVGVGQYLRSETRDLTDRAPLLLGLGFKLRSAATSSNGDAGSIELDAAFSRANGARLDVYGLGYTHRWNLRQPREDGSGAYVGLGAGVYRISYTAESEVFTDGSGPPPSISETATRVGGQVVLGYNMNKSSFLELMWRMPGSVEGANLQSLYLTIGGRF